MGANGRLDEQVTAVAIATTAATTAATATATATGTSDHLAVEVVGVGMHPFGRFPGTPTAELVQIAVAAALVDAGLGFDAIDIAYYAHVYDQGPAPAGRFLPAAFGLTGVPVISVENACASGSTAIWQAVTMLLAGTAEYALVVGAERVPRGPVAISPPGDPARLVGDDHMMANYAMRAGEYMHRHGATAESLATVAVKARRNAVHNDLAHQRSEVTVAEVLGSRAIAEPLTLLQCCPTSEGAAAAVLRAVPARRSPDGPRIRAATLRTDRFAPRAVHNVEGTTAAAALAFEIAGLAPTDIDLVQVHDAATIGELLRIEAMGLLDVGTSWRATLDGTTAIDGRLPVNTDGGLLSMGHPFGATGIRQLHETVVQLRGHAGSRQVSGASTGLIQCAGAGGVASVAIIADR